MWSWWPCLRRWLSVAVKPEISLWYMGYTLTRTGHEVWQLRFANGDIRLLQKLDIGQLITWSKFAPVAKHRAMKACRMTKIKFRAFWDLSSKWKSLITAWLQLPSSLWESPMGSFSTKLCESRRSDGETGFAPCAKVALFCIRVLGPKLMDFVKV